MKVSVAAFALLSLGNASAFTTPLNSAHTRLGRPIEISQAGPAQTTTLAALPSDYGESSVSMSNRVASAVAAGIISASTLGFGVEAINPPPAFAAAPPKTEKVVPEVANVEAAKNQLAAATKAIADYQTGINNAKKAESLASKDMNVAESLLKNAKNNLATSQERLSSLKSNPKFDAKAASTAESRVGKFCLEFHLKYLCLLLDLNSAQQILLILNVYS